VASAAFYAAMRFNGALGPIGRHGACGKCGRGQRPLPAALRFMARATPLCAKALAADPVGGLDRYLLPCASWPYAKALGASTYTLRTL